MKILKRKNIKRQMSWENWMSCPYPQFEGEIPSRFGSMLVAIIQFWYAELPRLTLEENTLQEENKRICEKTKEERIRKKGKEILISARKVEEEREKATNTGSCRDGDHKTLREFHPARRDGQ